MMEGLTASDVLALNRDGNGGFGDGNGSWLFIIVILALFGGFGGNGFGNRGGAAALTQAELCSGFNFNNLEQGVARIGQGICDSTFALNNTITNGFSNLGMATMQGFNGVDKSMCNISHQISDCCCETNRNIDAIRYENAKNTCDIITSQDRNTRAILDAMTQSELASLRTELAQAQTALNLSAQTANIVSQLKTPCPVPSFQVYPPAPVPVNFCGNSCGCGY